jgi:hypothetical protein
MRVPELELLWWEGCPSTDKAVAELREALAELGLERAELKMREIQSDAEARAEAFAGSPTILIDGIDWASDSDDEGEALGLTCRVYRRRNGAISPTPDPDDLREALRVAAEREEVTS